MSMAIKVALAAALLVALVAVASATTFTTTVTTTSFDEEENYNQCKQQVQGRQFRACQSYLKQRSSSPYGGEVEDEEVLANPQQRESVEQCCEQLREMDRQQCGCEAIKRAVKQVQEGSSTSRYQTGQSEQIYRKARALPRMCKLREQQCRFNVVFV